MKYCPLPKEPASLAIYRASFPNATWKEMRDDGENYGPAAYRDIKHSLLLSQRGLCAYCEIKTVSELDATSIQANLHEQRVEHFHPKSDRRSINWHLKWGNLLLVCLGGSLHTHDMRLSLEPLPANLSCDAHKDQVPRAELPENIEGHILSPYELQASLLLFKYQRDGTIYPHKENCELAQVTCNHYESVELLVSATIKYLNLNCNRLKRNRSIVLSQLEKRIAEARRNQGRRSVSEIMMGLARREFPASNDLTWPEYFSLIRSRLHDAAEMRLREIGFF